MRPLVAALLGVVLAISPAAADSQTTLDRDDSIGPLDIVAAKQVEAYIAQFHPEKHWMVLDMKLVTFEKWSEAEVSDPLNFVGFELNLDGDDNIERCILVQRRDTASEITATAYKGCSSMPRRQIGDPFRVRRPDQHTAMLTVRKRFLIGRARSYRWRGVTSYQDPEGNPNAACEHREYAPPGPLYASCADFTRWKRHRL